MVIDSARVANARWYSGSSSAGTPAATHAARALGSASSDWTTVKIVGFFRKESRRVPKWYSSAPKRSGRIDTCGFSRHLPSRSNRRAAAPPTDLVDTTHAVDRDLLHEHVFDDNLVRLDRAGLGGFEGSDELRIHGGVGHLGSFARRAQHGSTYSALDDEYSEQYRHPVPKSRLGKPAIQVTFRDEDAVGAGRPRGAGRGRPPGTSARALELIALQLFTENGFDETTVEQIAAQAGVSRRTFFRYFDSKASVLWHEFDQEVEALRAAFADVPDDLSMMDAIRQVVVGVNRYRAEDVAELRTRMNLIGSVPALHASAAPHYDAWEHAVSDFVAARIGQPADSLIPLAIGRTTLAACRAAFDQWVARGDADLTVYLHASLTALAAGFAEDAIATGFPDDTLP